MKQKKTKKESAFPGMGVPKKLMCITDVYTHTEIYMEAIKNHTSLTKLAGDILKKYVLDKNNIVIGEK